VRTRQASMPCCRRFSRRDGRPKPGAKPSQPIGPAHRLAGAAAHLASAMESPSPSTGHQDTSTGRPAPGSEKIREPARRSFPRFPRLAMLWVDAAYQSPCATWITATPGWAVEVVRKPPPRIWVGPGQEPPERPTGFQVLPRRWVVERTFAWLNRYRRLTIRYERWVASTRRS